MESKITLLGIFLTGNIVAGFMYYQWNLDNAAVLFPNGPSVPIIILSFAPPIFLLNLALIYGFLKQVDPRKRLCSRLVVPGSDDNTHALSWERLSAGFFIGLPNVGLIWSWHRFLTKGDVWNTATGEIAWRFEKTSPLSFFGDWDAFRYGDFSSGLGASFVPFWQPVLVMGLGSFLCFALTIVLIFKICGRYSTRAKELAKR